MVSFLAIIRRCLHDPAVSHWVHYRLVTEKQEGTGLQYIPRYSKRLAGNNALLSLFPNLLIRPRMHHSCSERSLTQYKR